MSSVIKTAFSTLTTDADKIIKDIIKAEMMRRKKAVQHVAKKMRKNIGSKSRSLPGAYPSVLSGNLKKSIKTKATVEAGNEKLAMIGSTAPHAHLLEFGHGDGKSRNKRPFFAKTLENEQDKIIEILSEEYW